MNNKLLEFLQELVEIPSPAGYEERNLEDWIRRIDEHADEVTTDSYGNTTATLNPGYNRSIVLTGHADEVGLMVRYISDDGFIYVKEIGTPHSGTTRGQRVVLQGLTDPSQASSEKNPNSYRMRKNRSGRRQLGICTSTSALRIGLRLNRLESESGPR